MFSITIQIGNQVTNVNIHPSHTAGQILDYLRQNGLISTVQTQIGLQFNGRVLPRNEPVSYFGIGPQAILEAVSLSQPGFGGGGKESLLQNLLQSFAKLKKS